MALYSVYLLVVVVVILSTTPALVSSQPATTWASGLGDDANPCSRTAPCKTFAGAISKTVAGGIIQTLDPGGFGAFTITKSITVDGHDWVSSVLVSGTNGINVNAPGATVTLRNIELNGISTGLNGIDVFNVGTLYVENVAINGFIQSGIVVAPPTSATQIFITNTRIANCASGITIGTNGTFSSLLQVSIDQSSVVQSTAVGVSAFSGQTLISNSAIVQSAGQGVYVGSAVQLDLLSDQISGNAVGLQVGVNATTRVSSSFFGVNTVDFECESHLVLDSNNILTGNTVPASC